VYEADPSLPSTRLEVSLNDDYKSSLPLEPDFVVDSPLTGLKEVINPPLTSSLFITPSLPSTPRGTTEGVLHLFLLPSL